MSIKDQLVAKQGKEKQGRLNPMFLELGLLCRSHRLHHRFGIGHIVSLGSISTSAGIKFTDAHRMSFVIIEGSAKEALFFEISPIIGHGYAFKKFCGLGKGLARSYPKQDPIHHPYYLSHQTRVI